MTLKKTRSRHRLCWLHWLRPGEHRHLQGDHDQSQMLLRQFGHLSLGGALLLADVGLIVPAPPSSKPIGFGSASLLFTDPGSENDGRTALRSGWRA